MPLEPTGAIERSAPGKFRVLCFMREFYPTSRVDVEVLFAQHLAARGHRIDLVQQAASQDITPGMYVWHDARAFAGATVPGHGGFSRLCRQLLEFAHGLRFLLRAQRHHYDAILVRDKIVFGAIAVPIARLKGLRFWFWLSFPFPEADLDHARSGMARFPRISRVRGKISGWLLYRWTLPHCDLAFVQSRRMKQVLSERGIDPRSLVPVPMGVDLQRLAHATDKPARQPSTAELGYLGTLDANRGLDILIDMLALLRRAGEDVRLVLIGDAHDARDRERILQHAREVGVAPYIEVTGKLPHARPRYCACQGPALACHPYRLYRSSMLLRRPSWSSTLRWVFPSWPTPIPIRSRCCAAAVPASACLACPGLRPGSKVAVATDRRSTRPDGVAGSRMGSQPSRLSRAGGSR